MKYLSILRKGEKEEKEIKNLIGLGLDFFTDGYKLFICEKENAFAECILQIGNAPRKEFGQVAREISPWTPWEGDITRSIITEKGIKREVSFTKMISPPESLANGNFKVTRNAQKEIELEALWLPFISLFGLEEGITNYPIQKVKFVVKETKEIKNVIMVDVGGSETEISFYDLLNSLYQWGAFEVCPHIGREIEFRLKGKGVVLSKKNKEFLEEFDRKVLVGRNNCEKLEFYKIRAEEMQK